METPIVDKGPAVPVEAKPSINSAIIHIYIYIFKGLTPNSGPAGNKGVFLPVSDGGQDWAYITNSASMSTKITQDGPKTAPRWRRIVPRWGCLSQLPGS